MQQCRVEYEPFQGQGEGYKDFVQFSKARMHGRAVWVVGGRRKPGRRGGTPRACSRYVVRPLLGPPPPHPAQAWIKGGHPVISVAFIPGEKDKDFDHVQPIVGITTKSKQVRDLPGCCQATPAPRGRLV